MAYPLHRVKTGDLLQPEDLNQYADAVERIEAKQDTAPGLVALAAVAASASVSHKPLTRRSLLFPWRRRG